MFSGLHVCVLLDGAVPSVLCAPQASFVNRFCVNKLEEGLTDRCQSKYVEDLGSSMPYGCLKISPS